MLWRVARLAVFCFVVGVHLAALSGAWLTLEAEAPIGTAACTLLLALLRPSEHLLYLLIRPFATTYHTIAYAVRVAARPLLVALGLQNMALQELLKMLTFMTGVALRELVLGYLLLTVCLFYIATHVAAASRLVMWAYTARQALRQHLVSVEQRAGQHRYNTTGREVAPLRLRRIVYFAAADFLQRLLLILTTIAATSGAFFPLANLAVAALLAAAMILLRMLIIPLFVLDLFRRVLLAAIKQQHR